MSTQRTYAPNRGARALLRTRVRAMLPSATPPYTAALCTTLLLAVVPRIVAAQAPSANIPMTDPLGLPMTRIGSGTAWLPDSAPMFGVMKNAGAWMFMLHGTAFLQQTNQGGARGDSQFGSVNSGMLNAMRGVAGGRLQLRAMASADVFTVGGRGYPLLLQTGESYRGESLHDRQHPHDMLMEIAALYERALTPNLAMQVYAAAAGEPALGPVAFPHRPAAAGDPFATLSHHWQDASHVSFGVATAGLYTRRVKVEGSVFNGREPDDVRTNLDFNGARLDSYSGRVSFNPTSSWALSASMGWLAEAEKAHPGETVRRAVGSALWSRGGSAGGSQSVSLIVGANSKESEPWSRSLAIEGLTDLRGRLQLYTRMEIVEKSGEELVLDHDGPLHDAIFRVAQLTIGGVRETSAGRLGRVGIGARATVNAVPTSLEPIYGSRTPLGGAVFLRWRTSRMTMTAMDHAHMKH
ncbi:MAG: hypothetical protein IT353_02145 [Gemmatimonadaceae bacterium]|nr:hypothetical protein [Gemmatimonadaceae bacterium]